MFRYLRKRNLIPDINLFLCIYRICRILDDIELWLCYSVKDNVEKIAIFKLFRRVPLVGRK